MLLAFLIAVGAEFEVFGPFVLPIFPSLTRPALLTLNAFFTLKIYFCH